MGESSTIPSNRPYDSKLFPMEEMLEVSHSEKKWAIGIPKEQTPHENRIALTPEAVQLLVLNGHRVVVQNNAGEGANYKNLQFSEAGAQLTDDLNELYQCDVILKVVPITAQEVEFVRPQQIIISSLHLTTQSEEVLRKLMQKKVTALCYEYLRDDSNEHPIMRVMSEISGIEAIMIASQYLSNAHNGKGVLLGGLTGITPAEVTIIGATTAAEYAARCAIGLGAMVKVFDPSIQKLRQLEQRLGNLLFTSIMHPQVLSKAFKSGDVIIGALDLIDTPQKAVISEDLVRMMKRGSVLIDLSIDQGGCFETSQLTTLANPTYTKYGVVHYCVPNLPSRVARTATIALSNIFAPLLLEVSVQGGIRQMLKNNAGFRQGVYIYNGILTNKHIGQRFNIRTQDIDLLMAVF